MALKVGNGLDLQGQKIVNQGDPTAPQDSATKAYVDNLVAGLAWKQPVRVATTSNGTLASSFANGSTVDGVVLATGDRILIKDQSTGSQNGIYVVASSGAPARATDADTSSEMLAATVYVASGSTNADKAFTQTADNVTLGTTALVFAQVGGGTSYTAGNGLTGSTTFSVLANGSSIDVSASGVKIADAAAGTGLGVSAGVLSVNTGTGLTVSGDNVTVDTSVVARKYSTTLGAVTAGTPVTVTHSLGNKNVTCQVYIESTGELVITDATLVDANSLTVTFAASQASGFYRVVVIG